MPLMDWAFVAKSGPEVIVPPARAVMADKETLTGLEQDVQITERTKHAMESYFTWLQNAMSASPWSNVDLSKKLMSYATDNVTSAVGLVQKLSPRLWKKP